MMVCQPCAKEWGSWARFSRHMVNAHNIDSAALWRRATQIGYQPVVAVLSEQGRWFLMVQGSLGL
jgi:hypothetical protein